MIADEKYRGNSHGAVVAPGLIARIGDALREIRYRILGTAQWGGFGAMPWNIPLRLVRFQQD
jgi:hypothetical protein